MKLIFPSIIVLLLFCGFARAQESNNYVSPTFQDILSRVVERDKTSGAILTVKPKSDSSFPNGFFSLTLKSGRLNDETVVTLKWNNKINDGIYEKYRLRTDDAMREEVKRQERYQQALEKQAKKREEQFAQEIKQKTSSTLRFGMTVAEVKTIKGKPISIERIPTQQLQLESESNGYINLIYPDMILYFINGNLWRLADIPKIADITNITLDKVTGNEILTPGKFKDLMRTAVPMSVFEFMHHSIPYGHWYEGSFRTTDGLYIFTLGLGGVNYLTTPSGIVMNFKFTEK